MRIDYGKVSTYTEAQNNTVGPSTSMTLRTVTAHNDGNSIYVAPNGDDGTGTGTAANPFLTLDKALATMGGKSILTVERNAWTGGDMIFDAPDVEIPVSLIMQVELGEVATIIRSDRSWLESNSLSKSWSALAYGDGLWVAGDTSGGFLYYSSDGINWTQSNSLSKNWLCLAYGDGLWVAGVVGGFLYYSSDGDTWTQSNSLSKTWRSVAYGDGLWVAGVDGGYLYYSSDGDTWTQSNSLSKTWHGLAYGDGLWVAGDFSIGYLYYSSDGINWTQSNSLPKTWRSLAYGNGLWVAGVDGGYLYYSSDGINWTQSNSLSLTWYRVAYGDGLWVAGVDGDYLYYSTDGINWTQSNSLLKDWRSVAYGNGLWVAGVDGGYLYYSFDTIIYIQNNTNTINGFYCEGNDVIGNGIVGTNNTACFFKWCQIQNVAYNGIVNFNQPQISNNVIMDLLGDGVTECNQPVVFNNIFSNIAGIGINHEGSALNLYHNTFYTCNTAIKLNDTITVVTALKNHLIDNCAYAVNSLSTVVEIGYSVINGELTNATPDSNSIVGAKVLFHDVINDDYHIRHLEEGYPIQSPGILLADDSFDSGAWNIEFSLDTVVWQEFEPSNSQILVQKTKMIVKPDSGFTFEGGFKRSHIETLNKFALTARESAFTDDLYHVQNIVKDDNVIQFWPQGFGSYTATANGTATWMDKTSVDGIVKLVADSTTLAAITAFLGDEQAEGMYLGLSAISGAITPHNTLYMFKVVQFDKGSSAFYLENIYNRWPGTGMDANPDGNYGWAITRALFSGVVQYTGLDSDGLYQLACTDLGQAFVKDQWAGTFINISLPYPFNRYMYVKRNDGTTLYCERPFAISTWPILNAYYYTGIDLVMAKSEPADVDSNAKAITDTAGEHSKHGNDWYSTKVTRDENDLYAVGIGKPKGYTAYNETGESVTLVQSKDFDDEGLSAKT